MPSEFEDFALVKFLARDKDYLQRVRILRQGLTKWLQHTAVMFPHYTSHARDHSDQIVLQLSNLLFYEGERKPTAKHFTQAEAYILICAAFLHDAGMVVSPDEIESALGSSRWKQFTTGKSADQLQRITTILRNEKNQSNDIVAYESGLQLRLLLAEFFRREHHLRAPIVLSLHPALRQLVDFDDRRYFEAISSVAVAHGLDRSELEDSKKFKEVVDLGGEKVNVRFLARLLRIGDLLDMRSERANPYACTAAGPLPTDSRPHWQQYSAIIHERVDPERIEFTCKCKDQDTHAVLRDWFGWLHDEIRETNVAMTHSERHSDWKPPKCTIDDEWPANKADGRPSPTIIIEPDESASYTFHRWKLELDHERILDLLVYDIYESTLLFLRELIQNALDATRCRMQEDYRMRHPEHSISNYITQLPEDFRKNYPLRISITEEEVSIPRTSEVVRRHVLTIEDMGTGMDSDVIRRYFLQLGRSYYQSEDFRNHYNFTPSSRFGIGFLSVFAASNYVVVETAKLPLPAHEPHGLRLTLQGPSAYLLTERCSPFETRPPHQRHGTRIRVALNSPLPSGELTSLAKHWCRRVEVPILVSDFDKTTSISSSSVRDRGTSVPSTLSPSNRFEIRSFKISEPGLEGEAFRLAYISNKGESWIADWDQSRDIADNPIEQPPELPESYITLHGILHNNNNILEQRGSALFNFSPTASSKPTWHIALDDRRPSTHTNLARSGALRTGSMRVSSAGPTHSQDWQSEIKATAQKYISAAIKEHLLSEPRANLEDSWRYAGQVLSDEAVEPSLRWDWPSTVPLIENNAIRLVSGNTARALPELGVLFRRDRHWKSPPPAPDPVLPFPTPVVRYWAAPEFFREWIDTQRLSQGKINSVRVIDEDWVAIMLSANTSPPFINGCIFMDLEGPQHCMIKLPYWISTTILNINHPFIQWVVQTLKLANGSSSIISPEMASALLSKVKELPSDDLDSFFDRWRNHPNIPSALSPPSEYNWLKLYSETIRTA